MILFRILTVLALIAIAGVMFIIGRGHTVYFDSKAVTYEGTTVEAPYKIEVYVKGERVAKLYEGERGMAGWMGQNFNMELEITAEKGGDSVRQAVSMTLPYNMDGIILNIPALLKGLPEQAYLSEFIPAAVEEEATEEVITDEFGITDEPGGGAEEPAP
ncbi:MAG: hypothetical protein K5989_03725 [Lachnospiraceae bacterium]|nr:hypothetical protein [Lachnospiraceae bacterium]